MGAYLLEDTVHKETALPPKGQKRKTPRSSRVGWKKGGSLSLECAGGFAVLEGCRLQATSRGNTWKTGEYQGKRIYNDLGRITPRDALAKEHLNK